MLDHSDDLVQPFQLEASHLRGRLVRMGSVLDIILHQHAYPLPVATLLAEAIVIAASLAFSLKYDGVFTLQAKGESIIKILVVDVMNDGGVRAYAQFDKDKLAADANPDTKLLGQGYIAFTCTLAENNERYQGIVALEGGSLAEAVQHYFRQSDQVPTGIITSASCDAQGRWRGGCLLLQRMPRDGGVNVESQTPESEDWTRTMIIMGTCTPEELTDSDIISEELLFRLFHEEGVRVYDPQPLRHQCRCSPVRVENMLRSLPRAEVEELSIGEMVTVTCEFCNKTYSFDKKARDQLYAEARK